MKLLLSRILYVIGDSDYVNGAIDMADAMVQQLDSKSGIDRIYKF